MKKKVKKFSKQRSYFDILFDNHHNKSFWKGVGLEALLVSVLIISFMIFSTLFVGSFGPLEKVYDPAVLQDPTILTQYGDDFQMIVFKLVTFSVLFLIVFVFSFSSLRMKEYFLLSHFKKKKGILRRYIIFNISLWSIYILYLVVILTLMISSYMAISVSNVFIYLNLFFFLLGVLGLGILMYVKSIGTSLLFINDKLEYKKWFKTVLRIHKFIPYLFVVLVGGFILFAMTAFLGSVGVLLMFIYYLYFSCFTRRFFIEVVENG